MTARVFHPLHPILGITALLLVLLSRSVAWADKGAEVRALTGAHTRITWLQDADPQKPCVYSERPTLRLMGFDSDDGKGERRILSAIGQYTKPIITADGSQVVFGNAADNTVYVVNWDGTGLRAVVRDATFQDVWTDPRTGIEWIYATVYENRGDKTIPVIRRFRMDNPKISELIWDRSPAFMFMVSGDGRVASGGIGNGGNTPQGMFTLPNGNFYQMAGGCWPSMSPDASHRMWVFEGNHRGVHFCIPDRDGKAYSFSSSFANAPGVKSYDEVYHPRWSNNINYITLTGPYAFSDWRWTSDVKISPQGAAGVEVYIGKFNKDFTGIEKWVIVTSNKVGDYWPDAWIEPDKNQKLVYGDEPVVAPHAGRISTKGQVFQWENGGIGGQIIDEKTGAPQQCTGQLRGFARYPRYQVLDLTGGAFVPDHTDVALLNACKASNQFSLELTLTPAALPDDAVIFAFASKWSDANVVLAQQGSWVTLQLKTDGAGTYTHAIPLCRLTMGQPNHLVISYRPGNLFCTLNGKPALVRNVLYGGFSTWTNQHLIFGDAWEGGRNWAGTMEGIGLFSRAIDQPEALERYSQCRDDLSGRKVATRLLVDARLTGYTPAVGPKAIAPYRRCLSVNQYNIDRVIDGQCNAKRINVAQWSIMDARVVPSYEKLTKGQSYRLTLESWADHPEQESERMMTGKEVDDVGDTPFFYDVSNTEAHTPTLAVPADAVWQGTGNWEAGASWVSGSPPGSHDNVILGNVAAGTRTVTISGPTTLCQLTMTQTQPGAVNQLELDDSLTLRGSAEPLALSTAKPDGVALNLNGQPLTFTNGTLDAVTFAGTVNMAGDGSVAGSVVVDGGSDYSFAPAVAFNGGDGRGASGKAVMRVASVSITRLGEDYDGVPTITISGPDIAGGMQATAIAQLNKTDGTVEGVYVTNPGSGYLRAPVVTISGGGGKGAGAQATLALDAIFVTDGGTGYVFPPTIILTGGDGDGAHAMAVMQQTTLQYTGGDGLAILKNTGDLTQDGSAVIFDWANTGQRNFKDRHFANEGIWTLKNAAVLKFLSSTGEESWFGSGNSNAGTLRLLSGSRLGGRDLTNTGTLDLGAGSLLGQQEFSQMDCTLSNAGQGIISVYGTSAAQPAVFGSIGPTNGRRTLNNGTNTPDSHAQLLVGNGEDTSTFIITGGNVYLNNAAGSTVEVRSGATLALITSDNGSPHKFINRDAKFTNAGNCMLAGRFVAQGNHGGAVMIDDAGTLTLQGDATFERLRSSTGPGGYYGPETSAQLFVHPGGVLQGSGTLTYINSTGKKEGRYLRVTLQGTTSPGTIENTFGHLSLHNADVGVTGTLQIDIGGLPSEVTRVGSLSVDGDGDTGSVELGPDSVLNIVPANGFIPHGVYRVLTASTLSGKFDQLRYSSAGNVPYTVNYLPGRIEVVFP